jgi:hypothetical protein
MKFGTRRGSRFDQAASLGVDHLSRAVETGVPCSFEKFPFRKILNPCEVWSRLTEGEKRREEKRKGGREREEERRGRGGDEQRDKIGASHLQELLKVVRCVSPKIQDLLVTRMLLQPFQTKSSELHDRDRGKGIDDATERRRICELSMKLWQKKIGMRGGASDRSLRC